MRTGPDEDPTLQGSPHRACYRVGAQFVLFGVSMKTAPHLHAASLVKVAKERRRKMQTSLPAEGPLI